MKKPLQKHSALALLVDCLTVSFAYLFAYFLRFTLEVVPVVKGVPGLSIYLPLLPIVLLIWIFFSSGSKLYSSLRKNSYFDEFIAVARSGSLATLILIALTFFYREYSFSRVMLMLFWGTSITLTSLARGFIIYQIKTRHQRGLNLQPVLIIGAGALGQIVAQKITELPQLGFRIAGFVDDHDPPVTNGGEPPKILGPIRDVKKIIAKEGVEQVFIALPRERFQKLEECLKHLDQEMVEIRMVPDILQFVFVKAGLQSLDGIPIIHLSETPLSGWYGPVKRLNDVVFSLAALVLLSPLFALMAVGVKLSSPGPVFYRQERMSFDGSLFKILKFRSMRVGAESETGAVWATHDDPRRTWLGALLRRTSLDELPQLLNILKGEMSFVGPRPERPVFVEKFRRKVPRYMMRHKVKCGLTGWAQINGWRGNTSIEKRIEYDIFYIENWSLTFDVKIILLTLWSGFVNKHAY